MYRMPIKNARRKNIKKYMFVSVVVLVGSSVVNVDPFLLK